MIDWLVQVSDMRRMKYDIPDDIDWGAWKKWTLKGTIESLSMAFRLFIGIVLYIALFGGILWVMGYLLHKFLSVFFG